MSNRLEAYFNDIEGCLGSLPPHVREGEVREISSHLQQLTDDLRTQGHNEDEATSLAIARFGAARTVGLRLRDVWEGNRGLFVTLLAVGGSNCLLSIINVVACAIAEQEFLRLLSNRALMEALAPAFVVWGYVLLLVLPVVLNFSLGRWGGRRILAEAPLAYVLLGIAYPLNYIQSSVICGCLFFSAGTWSGNSSVLFPYVHAIMAAAAFIGAWQGSATRRGQRWAAIGNVPFDRAVIVVAKPQRLRPRLVIRYLLILIAVSVLAFLIMKRRVEAALRPPTPEAAVRILLLDPGINSNEMEPATNVSLGVLLPATNEERAEQRRRVAYTATMHASEWYRRKLIACMQQQLQAAREGRPHFYAPHYARAALTRLKPTGYTVHGVLRVEETPNGWQVSESSEQDTNQESHLWAWLYDVYYQDIPSRP